MVARLTASSRAMEETVLSGRVSRSRAWRICSAVTSRWPPEALAAGAGGVQALAGAFDDQFADELGERGEDVEDQPAAGSGGVECLVQAFEAEHRVIPGRRPFGKVTPGRPDRQPYGDHGPGRAMAETAGRTVREKPLIVDPERRPLVRP